MLEVEVKLRVADLAPVRKALLALGAGHVATQDQDDVFFAHPQRDFAATDEALRLRRDADGLELTYKGPRQAGDGKVREEHGVRVEQDPTALLKGLGFLPRVRLRKHRESWRLGETAIELDHVEGLGSFVEVEALGDDAGAAGRIVEDVVKRLGLASAARTTQAYVELALAAGSQAATRL